MSNPCKESNLEAKYLKKDNRNNATEDEKPTENAEFEEKPSKESGIQKNRKKTLQQLSIKMFNIIKEIVIMLLALITYAALTSNPPKISKSPAAFPFFNKDSFVTDYYKGQLSITKERTRSSDMSFVMFYAPWSAECRTVRNEFEIAAKHFHKQIDMSAVNCWHPGSECRRQYSKVYNWPILIAYPSQGKGIQYKGPKTAPYIMRFLMGLMKPFTRVTRTEEIPILLASYDAVILGSVNALPGSHDFAVFYSTALRFLAQDPVQTTAFAIQTIAAENKYGKQLKPGLQVYLWNETLTYPHEEPWTPDALLEWISKTLQQITIWLIPPVAKSSTLAYNIQSVPSLILFTPRNPMKYSNDYYDLLREVALQYNYCQNQWTELIYQMLFIKRSENYHSHKLLLQKCAIKKEHEVPASVVTFSTKQKWINSSSAKAFKDSLEACVKCNILKDEVSRSFHVLQNEGCAVDDSEERIITGIETSTCLNEDINEYFVPRYETSMLKDEVDPKSPRNLQKLWRREKCRLLRIAEKITKSTFTDYVKNFTAVDESVEGLGCMTNRTLTMYALDSLENYFFAEKLGINLFEKKDKTAAVIINDKLETHYILDKPVDDKSLREFIKNYTMNTLPRSQVSITSIQSNNTYFYSVKTKCDTQKEICLKELDSSTFLPTVMQEDKAVIVMYHSKQCSFCNGIAYIFLTIAKIFSSIESIEFARIDGDFNILPWEYTMDTFPTIIYFPDKCKSESRVFPLNIPVTVPNLVGFLLTNLNPRLKLHAMWVLCNQTQFEDEKESCIASVRAENLSLIDQTLKEWRKTDTRRRSELMYRLQQLRSLHILFAHSPQRIEDIKIYLKRLNSYVTELKHFKNEQIGQIRSIREKIKEGI